MHTNKALWSKKYFHDYVFNNGIICNKGDEFGEFKMGSTIVLIFEGPKDLKFNLQRSQIIKYGEMIGQINSQTTNYVHQPQS